MTGLGQRGFRARILLDVADALASNDLEPNQQDQVIEDAVTQSAQQMRRAYTQPTDTRETRKRQTKPGVIAPNTYRHLIRLYLQQAGRAPSPQQIVGIIEDWTNSVSP